VITSTLTISGSVEDFDFRTEEGQSNIETFECAVAGALDIPCNLVRVRSVEPASVKITFDVLQPYLADLPDLFTLMQERVDAIIAAVEVALGVTVEVSLVFSAPLTTTRYDCLCGQEGTFATQRAFAPIFENASTLELESLTCSEAVRWLQAEGDGMQTYPAGNCLAFSDELQASAPGSTPLARAAAFLLPFVCCGAVEVDLNCGLCTNGTGRDGSHVIDESSEYARAGYRTCRELSSLLLTRASEDDALGAEPLGSCSTWQRTVSEDRPSRTIRKAYEDQCCNPAISVKEEADKVDHENTTAAALQDDFPGLGAGAIAGVTVAVVMCCIFGALAAFLLYTRELLPWQTRSTDAEDAPASEDDGEGTLSEAPAQESLSPRVAVSSGPKTARETISRMFSRYSRHAPQVAPFELPPPEAPSGPLPAVRASRARDSTQLAVDPLGLPSTDLPAALPRPNPWRVAALAIMATSPRRQRQRASPLAPLQVEPSLPEPTTGADDSDDPPLSGPQTGDRTNHRAETTERRSQSEGDGRGGAGPLKGITSLPALDSDHDLDNDDALSYEEELEADGATAVGTLMPPESTSAHDEAVPRTSRMWRAATWAVVAVSRRASSSLRRTSFVSPLRVHPRLQRGDGDRTSPTESHEPQAPAPTPGSPWSEAAQGSNDDGDQMEYEQPRTESTLR